MLLCRCMNLGGQCPNTHWADLTDEQKKTLLGNPPNAVSIHEEERSEEDKSWPPNTMETK